MRSPSRFQIFLPFYLAAVTFTVDAAVGAEPAAPATRPLDHSTPIAACRAFDQSVAGLGVDGAISFYHCTSNAQRRFARSECEYYVALNRLVRSIKAHQGDAAAAAARQSLGDDDDYADAAVETQGDYATVTRSQGKPLQLIRIDGQWRFSMPDWFAQQSADDLQTTRLYYESAADQLDAVREQIDAGQVKSPGDIDSALQKISAAGR